MKEINKAFAEVSSIIKHMDKEMYVKIPKGFIGLIENNKDKEYKVNIDYTKSINEQKLLQDTRVILALIYRDYFCSPDKKQQLITEDKEEIRKAEKILKEKYEIDFEKINTQRLEKKSEEYNEKAENFENQMICYPKESFIKRIINKILNFLHFFRK